MDHTFQKTLTQKLDNSKGNVEVNEEMGSKIPSQFFNMVSMPRNWEQVEKLKNRRQMLREHLFSQTHKCVERDTQNEDEMESDEDIIDVETVSEKNDDSVTFTSIEDSVTFTSIEVSVDDEEDSDESLLSLKIVEDGGQNEELESSEIENSSVQNILKSLEEERRNLVSRKSEVKMGSEQCASKQIKKTASQLEPQTFDEKSDLCLLSATDINNSLFDTIASLTQQSLPETNLKKQSSLENIINRIKSEAECNKSAYYHIQKPSVNGSLPSIGDSISEGSFHSSKHKASEADTHLPNKEQTTKAGVKDSKSQVHLENEPLSVAGSTYSKEPGKAHLSSEGQETNSPEICPVKLKLKKYLRTQQNFSDKERKSHGHDNEEKNIKQLLLHDNELKNQSQASCCQSVDEKPEIVCDSEANSDAKKGSAGVLSSSSKIPKEENQNVNASASPDDLYKLKYECIQNQIKLLKYESKLLGLKEKLLEKRSMQHYYKTLMDRCRSRKHRSNSWVVINKAESGKSVSKAQFTDECEKPQDCVSSDSSSGGTSKSPILRTIRQEHLREGISKQPSTEKGVTSVAQTGGENPSNGTSDQPMVVTQVTPESDTKTAENKPNQPSDPIPYAEDQHSSCQTDKKGKHDRRLASHFIIKTSTDFQKTHQLIEISGKTPTQCQTDGFSQRVRFLQEKVPKNEGNKEVQKNESKKEVQKHESKEVPKHGNSKDHDLCVKQTEVSSGVNAQALPVCTHPVELPNSTSTTMNVNTTQVSKLGSCQAKQTMNPLTTQGTIIGRPKLYPAIGLSTMYSCSPRSPGYQILRPQRSIGKLNIRTLPSGSVKNPNILIPTSSVGNAQPLNSLQIVQVQSGSADGRLYALVNNVLEPIVQKVNDQFLPLVANPTLQSGMSQGRPTVLPSISNSKSILSPLKHCHPQGHPAAVSSTSLILPSQQIVNSSNVPCTKGLHALPSTKQGDERSKIETETSQILLSETSEMPATVSVTPSNLKGQSHQVMTLVEGVSTGQSRNTSGSTNVLKNTIVTCYSKTNEVLENIAVTGKASPRVVDPQKMIDKFVCLSGGRSLLAKQPYLEKVNKAEKAKPYTEYAKLNIKKIQVCDTHASVSSARNVETQSNNEVIHDRAEMNSESRNETGCPPSTSGITCPSTPVKSDSPVFQFRNISQAFTEEANVLCRNTSSKSVIVNQRSTSGSLGKTGKASIDGQNSKQKEIIQTIGQEGKFDSNDFKDANNNLVLSDVEEQKCVVENEEENGREKKNSQAYCEQTIDSEDSFDSIDWERYEDICKGNSQEDSAKSYCSSKKQTIYTIKKTPTTESNGEATTESNGEATKGCKRKKSQSPVLPGDKSQHSMTGYPTQVKSDKEVPKKIVKTKLIILKGEICDRWQEIKKRTFLCEGLSDASFVHYLLNLAENRQAQMHKHYRKEKEEKKKTGVSIGCVGDAAQYRDIASVTVSHSAVRGPGTRGVCSKEGTTTFASMKSNSSETPKKQNKEKSPMVTRSKTYAERKPECYTIKSIDPEKAATKRNLKRKLESSVPEVTESFASKRGRFEFLSETTKRQMSWALSVFMEWLKQRGEDYLTIYMRDAAWLDEKLRMFYLQAKTLDGRPYHSRVLQTFRRALSMCLAMFSNKANIKIGISLDSAFDRSNKLLTNIMRGEEENEESRSEPISNANLEKLYSTKTLSEENPTSLSWKVYFDVVHHLCKPKMPQSFLESLEKHHLTLESDINGVYYSLAGIGYVPDCEMPGRMYATPSDPDRCPVRTASLYLSKLDKTCSRLFQCPYADWSPGVDEWYSPLSMKKEHLSSLMECISTYAKLSSVYTIANVMATPKCKPETM